MNKPRNTLNNSSLSSQLSSIKAQIRNLHQETNPQILVRGGTATKAGTGLTPCIRYRKMQVAPTVSTTDGTFNVTMSNLPGGLSNQITIRKIRVVGYGANYLKVNLNSSNLCTLASATTSTVDDVERTVYANPYNRTPALTFDIPDASAKWVDPSSSLTPLLNGVVAPFNGTSSMPSKVVVFLTLGFMSS